MIQQNMARLASIETRSQWLDEFDDGQGSLQQVRSKAKTGLSFKGSSTVKNRPVTRIGSCSTEFRSPLVKNYEIESSPDHRS